MAERIILPFWTAQTVVLGDPTTVCLGIDWGDGTQSQSVTIPVPAEVVAKGAEAIGHYFINGCIVREAERLAKARAAYHRYGAVTDFKNYQGNPMPDFDSLPRVIQQAWVAAANETPVWPDYEKAPQTTTPAAGSEAHPVPAQPEVAPAVSESPTPYRSRSAAGDKDHCYGRCSSGCGTCPGR